MTNLSGPDIEDLKNIASIKHQLTMLHPDPSAPSFQLALALHLQLAMGYIIDIDVARDEFLALLDQSTEELDRCVNYKGSANSLVKGGVESLSLFLADFAKRDQGKTLPFDQYMDWTHLLTIISDRVDLGAQLSFDDRIIFKSENILLVGSSLNPEDQGLVGNPEPLLAAKPEGTNLWNYYGDGFMNNQKPSEQELIDCRAAVANYKGPALGGPCTSRKAERFCIACGLTVINGVAYLGKPSEAIHHPKPYDRKLGYTYMKAHCNKLQTRVNRCRSKKAARPTAKGFA